MNTKKLICMTLALMLALSCLAGCGSTAPAATTEAATTAATEAAAETTAEDYGTVVIQNGDRTVTFTAMPTGVLCANLYSAENMVMLGLGAAAAGQAGQSQNQSQSQAKNFLHGFCSFLQTKCAPFPKKGRTNYRLSRALRFRQSCVTDSGVYLT